MYLHSYADYAAEADGLKLESLPTAYHPGSLVNSTSATQRKNVADAIKTRNVVDGVKYYTHTSGTGGSNDLADFGGGTTDASNTVTGSSWTATARGVLHTDHKAYKQEGQLLFAASEGLLGTVDTNMLTAQIEDVQAKVNTARVQAGSQYAAIESAVNYTTDLTAQYELGFNTVNDVNFSMETAHLAKNQILQQAATAMLAQANQGQQGLLQLIQS